MKNILFLFILASTGYLLSGCGKKVEYYANPSFSNESTAFLKINYGSMYTANPAVQLSLNGTRVSSLISNRTPFPGGGYNTNGSNYPDYLAIEPGNTTFKISIPNKNMNTDSILLYQTSFTVEKGKYYTLHVADTFTRTRSVLLEDAHTAANGEPTKYRFVNLMPNVSFVDLYYGPDLVASAVPYMSSSPYFTLPYQPSAATWTIRETSTGASLATYLSSNTILNYRIYSAFALGYKGSTALNTKPFISFLLNR